MKEEARSGTEATPQFEPYGGRAEPHGVKAEASAKTGKTTIDRIMRHKCASAPNKPEPLVMVTAYDAPTARLADEAGVDILLVGDSLAMVVMGHSDTLAVTVEEMAYHTKAVARAKPQALIVSDMPWLSYHISAEETVRNAAALIRAGAQAVKLEGCRPDRVEALLNAEIPVMGHLGLTPQSVNVMGGFKVQGKTAQTASDITQNAKEMQAAGCFSMVLEGVPSPVAAKITSSVHIPTIGIGAGPDCDGQVLVFHDLLGFGSGMKPKFVRTYEDLGGRAVQAIRNFADDVRSGKFPSEEESYSLGKNKEEVISILDTPSAS